MVVGLACELYMTHKGLFVVPQLDQHWNNWNLQQENESMLKKSRKKKSYN